MPKIVSRSQECIECRFCDYFVQCPGGSRYCLGCGICIKGCPEGARSYQQAEQERPSLHIVLDGEQHTVPSGVTVGHALELVGKYSQPEHSCCSGGCFSCAVLVDGRPERACCSEIRDGAEIVTARAKIEQHPPLRLISIFPGHMHASVSVFTHGCNFNCDFCHNWNITFDSRGIPYTPRAAAEALNEGINFRRTPNARMGISGGEPTLNRRWLVGFVAEMKARAPELRIQVDTNASLLTRDYLEELYQAGMTDISPDLKGLYPDTFIKLTGVEDRKLAQKYLDTSWQAVESILTDFDRRLYTTVGLPYHPQFISREELFDMGQKLASFNKNIDVNLIVYLPAFRQRYVAPVDDADIDEAMDLLNQTGINRVWCQEGEDIPLPTDPDDLVLLGENF